MILSVPFCPYHFVRCHFVLEPTRLFGRNSRQLCDKYLTHLTISSKPRGPHLLLYLNSSFTPNSKCCSSTNPILNHPPSLPVSKKVTSAHAVCLNSKRHHPP